MCVNNCVSEVWWGRGVISVNNCVSEVWGRGVMCVNNCVSEECWGKGVLCVLMNVLVKCVCVCGRGEGLCVINCVSEVCGGEGNVMCVSIYVGERERDRERVRYKVFYYALVSVRVLVCASLC